jgi:hypothetical protein
MGNIRESFPNRTQNNIIYKGMRNINYVQVMEDLSEQLGRAAPLVVIVIVRLSDIVDSVRLLDILIRRRLVGSEWPSVAAASSFCMNLGRGLMSGDI